LLAEGSARGLQATRARRGARGGESGRRRMRVPRLISPDPAGAALQRRSWP
jgi:hypothetical protein